MPMLASASASSRDVAPSGSASARLPCAAEARERGVACARRDERDAERQPARGEAGRQRERAPAEQVDEVGVGAELRVRADRVGVDLGDASGGRARSAPSAGRRPATARRCRAALRAARYWRTKRIGRAEVARRSMTLRTVRSSACGSRSSSACTTACRSATHGPPYSSSATAMQRREVDLFDAVAERAHVRDRLFEGRAVAGVAARTPAAPGSPTRSVGGSCATPTREVAVGVARVGAFDHRKHLRRVATQSARRPTRSRGCGTRARTPAVLTRPGVGFRPTMLLKPAGTRPEPAVSVPSANGTSPRDTTTAEPELEPPLHAIGCEGAARPRRRASACRPGRWRTGRGWSCRSQTAPASSSRATTVACAGAMYANAGQAAVVGSAGDVDVVLDRERHPKQGHRSQRRFTIGVRCFACLQGGQLRVELRGGGMRYPRGLGAFDEQSRAQRAQQLTRRAARLISKMPVRERERDVAWHAVVWCTYWYTGMCTAGSMPLAPPVRACGVGRSSATDQDAAVVALRGGEESR